jgi:hypothetical protein
MSRNKRAAICREQKEHDKNKLSMNEKQWFIKQTESGIGKSAFEKLMQRYYKYGHDRGMELAAGIIFLALHEHFGFGTKRIQTLMKCISDESIKMDEEPTKFNVNWYIQQLNDVLDIQFQQTGNVNPLE